VENEGVDYPVRTTYQPEERELALKPCPRERTLRGDQQNEGRPHTRGSRGFHHLHALTSVRNVPTIGGTAPPQQVKMCRFLRNYVALT
jgi:hypothetical protein